jgi:2-polyprenyl-3-methyl-5-hydroxy-6-metoxy-1,4-benzoquinol methylase
VRTTSAAAGSDRGERPWLAGPSLALDQPLTERILFVHERLDLSGWAVSPSGIGEVAVEVAGRSYQASRGLPSPDLEALLPEIEGSRFGRFELRLPTRDLPRGRERVEVRATDAAGASVSLAGIVELQPFEPAATDDGERLAAFQDGRTEMWCDEPNLDGSAEFLAPIRVAGWAHCSQGIESVFVDVDDRLRIEAAYGFRYPLWFVDGTSRRVGFAATIDPREIGPGRHVLTVVALGRDGRSVGRQGEVVCLEPPDADGPPSRYEARQPVPALTDGSRYVPDAHTGMSLEAEHHVRYRWAAALAPGRRVLDVACGSGFGTQILAAAGAASVVGVDSEPIAVEEARRGAPAATRIELGRIERLPFVAGAFDLVVCFETIEHVEEQQAAFDELRRVLAADGFLLISSPNRGVFTAENPFHVAELASRELETELRRRFRHVVVYGQQTHVASYLLGDRMF